MQNDVNQPETSASAGSELDRFLALPVEKRLSLILDRTFASWCAHANDGVSLVYDHATLMIAKIVKQILAVEETDSFAHFEVFSTRMVLNIETGYDAYDPDAGAFQREGQRNEAQLFMIETAVRAMSSADAPFDPRYLVPQDPQEEGRVRAQFHRIFSTQFRFWTEDHPSFAERLAALRARMAEFPQITLAEMQLNAKLRKTNQFRLKRKVLDFCDTQVRGIAIGLDWPR